MKQTLHRNNEEETLYLKSLTEKDLTKINYIKLLTENDFDLIYYMNLLNENDLMKLNEIKIRIKEGIIYIKNIVKLNENNNIVIKGMNIKKLSKSSLLYKNQIMNKDYNYFITINPYQYVSPQRLKESFEYCFMKYLRYTLGKQCRKLEKPFKFDLWIELCDDDIHFNHIHIITDEISYNQLIDFQGFIFYYMEDIFKNVHIYTKEIRDINDTTEYVIKAKTKDKNGNLLAPKYRTSNNAIYYNQNNF